MKKIIMISILLISSYIIAMEQLKEDSQYSAQEKAIDDFLQKYKYVNSLEARFGIQYPNNIRRNIMQDNIKKGIFIIDTNGYLQISSEKPEFFFNIDYVFFKNYPHEYIEK